MRDQWYGDDRDVVKWGAIVHLARREKISTVIHVAMYRVDPPPALLATAFGNVEIPVEVIRHFRSLGDIARLGAVTGLEIELLKQPFTDRVAYFEQVCERISARSAPVIVFLDPDVGLAFDIAGPEHVTSTDVSKLFSMLRRGDMLVCYQHARRQKDWRGRARRAFANAPGMPSFEVEALSSKQEHHVLLLAVKKQADAP
jgi:hypothetical protein